MADRLAGKRLLVVEEALKDRIGHWYEYVKSVAELNAGQGVEVTVGAHCRIDPEIAAEIDARPLFARTNWDGVYAHPQAWRRYLGIARHNWLVFRTMNRFVRQHGPFDCLFAPTVVIHHIWGWRLLLFWQRRRIGRMVLLFRNNAGAYAPGSSTPVFKRSAMVFAWALRSFAVALREGRAAFATDSARLAREYELLCGIAPKVFPSPRVAPFPALEDQAKPLDAPLVFSCLGPARFEKGIDLLQEAIRLLLAGPPARPVQFVVQWNQPILNADGSTYHPDPHLLADPRVTFLTGQLDSAGYDRAVAETDCMLLPYRRESYFARISGVAVEAATAGIAMIYTQDTWTSDFAEMSGAGIAIADGDAAALAQAMRDMAENYAHFRALARERRKAAQQANSPEAFLAKLWGREL
ncbi:MAG: glycosyltransferase [Novosphingobium sp.]